MMPQTEDGRVDEAVAGGHAYRPLDGAAYYQG
jgi:hypothetical protein